MQWKRLSGESGHDAGRALLRQMYREYTGQEMPEILYAPAGKPYFAHGPHFSISHTKKHVFCALSDKPIGLDAEEKDREVKLRLAEKILSPVEFEQYENAADKRETLLRFWVLKEAAAKCSGEGLKGFPNQTEFSLENVPIQEIDGCLVAIIEEDN